MHSKGSIQLNVLHLVQGLQVGGLEAMVCNLLTGLDREAYHPRVCCFDTLGPLSRPLQEQWIPCELLPRRPGWDYTYPARLGRYLRRHNVDILHLHNPTALFYGTLAGKWARTPAIVYTEHGRDHSSSWKVRLANKAMSELVDRVAVVADAGRRRLVDREWMRDEKIVTIANGIDGVRFKWAAGRNRARAELGLDPDIPILCIAARLDPIKNHALLLRALDRIRREVPAAELLVAGDGPLRPELETQAEQLGLASQVRFLGDRDDVPRLLAACDVFVLPSLSEGLSMTLLEACASARPIVATRVGGNPEVVEDGRNGLLVPSGDEQALAGAVLSLLRDEAKARAMGRSGRDLFERKFSRERMVQEYEKLYTSILRQKGVL